MKIAAFIIAVLLIAVALILQYNMGYEDGARDLKETIDRELEKLKSKKDNEAGNDCKD